MFGWIAPMIHFALPLQISRHIRVSLALSTWWKADVLSWVAVDDDCKSMSWRRVVYYALVTVRSSAVTAAIFVWQLTSPLTMLGIRLQVFSLSEARIISISMISSRVMWWFSELCRDTVAIRKHKLNKLSPIYLIEQIVATQRSHPWCCHDNL